MKNKTVFVIGAGSTRYLGMPTSEEQTKLIYKLKENCDGNLFDLSVILDETFGEKNYNINDVYNFIDSNLLLHNALQSKSKKIEYYELEKCKKDLIKHILSLFLEKLNKKDDEKYNKLVNFYKGLAEKELQKKINGNCDFQDRKNFVSSYSIINFNWDLYSLFPVIKANEIVNHNNDYYLATGKNPKLRMYLDFNCEYAGTSDTDKFWYPFTETAALNVNNDDYEPKRKVVLTKYFLPHGAMNFFKCTSCAKHSYFLGKLDIDSVIEKIDYNDDEKELYKCPYCEKAIYSNDFDVLAQSNFKTRNSYLEEVRLSMMQELRSADTLVFIGYSMPDDDVDYITMFKSLNCNIEKVYVVLRGEKAENSFVGYGGLTEKEREEIKNYHKVFKEKAVYNMAGAPDAFDEILKVV